MLIDVPNNSLFFVWDFLDDEYQATKDVLNEYFFSKCDDSYFALKDKISSLYSESVTFDDERGILTVNFAGLQTYETADLTGVAYNKESNGVDFANGVFTVYSQINGVPVKKVIFKGSYYQTDRSGRTKTTKFSNLSIRFDKWWNTDIEIVFDSFSYIAPKGKIALDISETSSANVKISVINQAYIEGGAGVSGGKNGAIGINASGKKVTIAGEKNTKLEVLGGNGISATTAGGNGGAGGIAVIANQLIINTSGNVTARGGNGGAGKDGANGANGAGNDAPGEDGKNGGNGGTGASAIKCSSIIVKKSATVNLTAGVGGAGGAGGRGGDGRKDNWPFSAHNGKGGNGGNGGNGGACANALDCTNVNAETTITYKAGEVGAGGVGGNGGNGGRGSGGGSAGGSAGIGGLSGDGKVRATSGIAGSSNTTDY